MPLSQQFQEFVDEVTGAIHEGEPVNVRIHHAAREFFDLVDIALEADANVDELSNEAVAAVNVLLSKLALGVIARRLATSAVPWVVPPLIEAMAAFAGTGQEFVNAHILPSLDLWIETLVDVRNDLADSEAK